MKLMKKIEYYENSIGIDEVGRGCLAGPVVAAAVVLPRNFEKLILKDSKKLSFKQTPSPYLMFVRVLNEYFKDRDDGNLRFPKQITNSKFNDYKYQLCIKI